MVGSRTVDRTFCSKFIAFPMREQFEPCRARSSVLIQGKFFAWNLARKYLSFLCISRKRCPLLGLREQSGFSYDICATFVSPSFPVVPRTICGSTVASSLPIISRITSFPKLLFLRFQKPRVSFAAPRPSPISRTTYTSLSSFSHGFDNCSTQRFLECSLELSFFVFSSAASRTTVPSNSVREEPCTWNSSPNPFSSGFARINRPALDSSRCFIEIGGTNIASPSFSSAVMALVNFNKNKMDACL